MVVVQVRSNLFYLICLRHLIRSRKKLFSFMRAQPVLSYHLITSTMSSTLGCVFTLVLSIPPAKKPMVLMVDGISEIGAHVRSNICSLFKAFDYFESSHKSDYLYPKRPVFLHACATCSQLPFYI